MGRVSRAVPALLLHANLLLMLFAGAMLATGARLKWDPSAYIAARELLPREYYSAACVLPAAGAALLLLAHLALAALSCRRPARRVLLILYASLMAVLSWCGAWWGAWLTLRVLRWARGPSAADLRHAVALQDDIHPLLQHLAHFHPLPEKVNRLMQEAKRDLPLNMYMAAGASAALLLLQAAAAALALAAALAPPPAPRRPRPPRDALAHSTATAYTPLSIRRGEDGIPLRTAYKNGRLVVL